MRSPGSRDFLQLQSNFHRFGGEKFYCFFFFKLQFLSAFKTKKKQEGILTNS